MTVSISPAPAAKPASPDMAAPAKAKDVKFDKLIDTAVLTDGPVETPLAASAPDQAQVASQSLDALLAALKLTLAPGAALLKTAPKKAGDTAKPAAKDQPAEDKAADDPAAALLVALGVPAPAAPLQATKSLAGQAAQAVDDVLAKTAPGTATSLPSTETTAATVPLPFDLGALAAPLAVKAPEQPAPVNAQIDRLVDTARDAAWLDRLSQDIAASAGAGDRLKFRMMPPNLGTLDVAVERQASGMSVAMTTHTADARNLIADSRQQMVDSLKAQGVPLIELSLSSAGEDQAGHRPPTFFNHLIEAAPLSGTDLAAQPVETTTAERVGRFA